MKFTEAFRALGYTLDNHQNEWSAKSNTGVCITIWKVELKRKNHMPIYELAFPYGEPLPEWTNKIGHRKRTKHLCSAVDEFDGYIDVVLLDGPSGGPYKDAYPWNKETRGFGWRVVCLDRNSGGFRAEIDISRPFADLP